jgi:hypothetical protein
LLRRKGRTPEWNHLQLDEDEGFLAKIMKFHSLSRDCESEAKRFSSRDTFSSAKKENFNFRKENRIEFSLRNICGRNFIAPRDCFRSPGLAKQKSNEKSHLEGEKG